MRHTMVGQCLQHLLSDSVWYFSHTLFALLKWISFRADGKLGHRQRKLHDPLIDWFQNRFNCPLQVFSGFSVQEQHEDTVNILRWHLHSLDDWTLAGWQIQTLIAWPCVTRSAVETLCRTNKSIVVALAVADGQLTAEVWLLLTPHIHEDVDSFPLCSLRHRKPWQLAELKRSIKSQFMGKLKMATIPTRLTSIWWPVLQLCLYISCLPVFQMQVHKTTTTTAAAAAAVQFF